MALNGIDISHHQGAIDLKTVLQPDEFVIIKATQGKSYVDPMFKRNLDIARSKNLMIGVYHYVDGSGIEEELNNFIHTIGLYIGKVVVALDWEGDSNKQFKNPKYLIDLANAFYNDTLVTPVIYMSKSVCRQYDWSAIADKFPLWVAQYANNNKTGYQVKPWTDAKGYGAWKEPLIFQYSSNGRLNGHNGDLDLDIAYMNRSQWVSLASKHIEVVSENQNETKKMSVEAAANLVIEGKFGNGDQRKQLIKEAGLDYNEVQSLVNKKLQTAKNVKYVVIAKNGLRIRSTPSTKDNSNVLDAYVQGTNVVSDGMENNGFLHIVSPRNGWMSKEFLGKAK